VIVGGQKAEGRRQKVEGKKWTTLYGADRREQMTGVPGALTRPGLTNSRSCLQPR
jgi:hypothetical protein